MLVVIFLIATIAAGGWLTGQWIAGDLSPDKDRPGYFLPTVAGRRQFLPAPARM